MKPAGAAAEAGFTLVEVIISLALFALIALAGFTMLDGMMRVQERTDGRLERLGELQRAMQVLTLDLEQISPGPLVTEAEAVSFSRAGEGGEIFIRYDVDRGVFRRTLGAGESGRVQRLLTGVERARWRYYVAGRGWLDDWPPPGEPPPPGRQAHERPTAVAVELTLAPAAGSPSGVLRRVVELPVQP